MSSKIERVITYIDGFNLYFGLKSIGFDRYLWLDVRKLSKSLLRPRQTVVFVNYFTARICGNPEKARRQSTYLEAIQTLPDTSIQYGQYEAQLKRCPLCGERYLVQNEKRTDVNIAVQMLTDAVQDRFDTALLLSGDSDLAAAIEGVRQLHPNKSVVCAFPPKRTSNVLKAVASAHFVIGRSKIAQSQFPDSVVNLAGHTLTRPDTWR